VVEAERIESNARWIDADNPREFFGGVRRDVAEPHRAHGCVLEEGLGDDPGRVAQVENPRVRRHALDGPGNLHDHGDGAKRTDEPAGARRLVAHQTELHRQRLVALAGGQPSHPDLGQDKVRSLEGPLEVRGRHQPDRRSRGIEHALADAGDELDPLDVEVNERHFVDIELPRIPGQLGEQLHGVAASAAHYDNLQRAPPES